MILSAAIHEEQTKVMKPRDRWLVHRLIVVVAVGVFVAAHGAVLYYVSLHGAVSIAAAALIFIVIKHLGLLGPLLAWLRRRRPPCVQ